MHTKLLVALLAIVSGRLCYADAMASGSVSYNSGSGLYTYSYTLNNTSSLNIFDFYVLINSADNNYTTPPAAHVDPDGWPFQIGFSGTIANPLYNEFGTFWGWVNHSRNPPALPPEGELGGFSFSTTVAPVGGSANNYFIWAEDLYDQGAIVDYGHIVAPDLGRVPEPTSIVLLAVLLAGAGLAALLARRLVRA